MAEPTPIEQKDAKPENSLSKGDKKVLTFKSIGKTLDGNILIQDHPKVMFIIAPSKRKLTLMLKHNTLDEFYPIQKRFLEFAVGKGIVVMGTEHTGYLPGMFEFTYPEDPKVDSVKVMLYFIYTFLQTELEMYEKLEKHRQDLETRLLQPDEEDSTELGEIPHERKKGVDINPYRNYVNSVFGWYL